MKANASGFTVAKALFIGFFSFAFLVAGGESNGNRLQDLLAKITQQWNGNVARNERGEVVSIRLYDEFLAETNFGLIRNLPSLTNVILRYSSTTPLTEKAVDSLAAAPNLKSVELACFFSRIEPGVFPKLCSIRNLTGMILYGACPTHEDFRAITNLQNLTFFAVAYSKNFGKQDLSVLTALPRLNSLVIAGTMVTNTDTNILKSCPSLTNFVFNGNRPQTNASAGETKSGGQIIRVPSAAEREKGAKIEVAPTMDSNE